MNLFYAMLRLSICFLFLFTFVKTTYAQSWQQNIDVSLDDRGSAIVSSPDGGLLFLGQDFEMENAPYTLVRCDQEGDTIWTRTFAMEGDISLANQFLLTDQGEIVLVGSFLSTDESLRMFLRKHSANGQLIEEYLFDIEGGVQVLGIQQNEDGEFLLGGSICCDQDNDPEAFCMGLSAEGTILWEIRESVDFWPEHGKLIQANDGNYIFFHASFDEFTILRFAGDGQVIDVVTEYTPTGPYNLTGSLLDIVPYGNFGAILLEREQLLYYDGNGVHFAVYHTAPLSGKKIIQNHSNDYFIIGNLNSTEELALAKINVDDPDPEDILIWTKNLESNFFPNDHSTDDGTFLLFFEDEEASLGDQVCVDLKVKNFTNILGAQFSIQYDPNMLSFVSVGNFGLPALNENIMGLPVGINGTDPGHLTVAWTDPTLSGVTVFDNTTLFEICFDVTEEFAFTTLNVVDQPTNIQIISGQAQIVPYETHSGFIGGEISRKKSIKANTMVTDTGLVILSDYRNDQQRDYHLLKVDFDQIENTTNIFGKLFIEDLPNCDFDEEEDILWEAWIIQLVNEAGEIQYTSTQSDGSYFFTVPVGNYTISAFSPFDIWDSCPSQEVEILDTVEEVEINIGMPPVFDCATIDVYTSSSNFRSCMEASISISYQNIGYETANNVFIETYLHPAISIQNSNVPFEDLGNHLYRFELGNLVPGGSGDIYLTVFIDCDIEVGSALCITSQISAENDCISQYEGAVLTTSASCNDTEIQFNIENIGSADMLQPTSYLVIEDNIILMHEELDLDAGEDILVPIEVQPFSTYRIEVLQESDFPSYLGDTISAISLENCNGLTAGLVNAFPSYDGAPYWDRYCKEVTGSYDPNDKQALPTGLEEAHYIPRNTQLKYTIRFQNTGTDTAFTVILRDQLSEHLDVTSFRPGASSHPYSVQLEGTGELQFTFNDILLPDSTTNEIESQGFVQFEINQKDNLPLGTLIYNEAAIYFDFNEPIITNETWHTIGENYLEVISANTEEIKQLDQIKISPNPFKEEFTINIGSEPKQAQLSIFNTDGRGVGMWQLNSLESVISTHGLPSGVYFYRIEEKGFIRGEGRLIKVAE